MKQATKATAIKANGAHEMSRPATARFLRHAYGVNVALMGAGFLLAGYQLTGWALS